MWEAVDNRLSAEAERQMGIVVKDAKLQRAIDAFRRAHGLYDEGATKKWLGANSLSVEAFEAYLTRCVLSNKVKAAKDH